MDRKSFNRFFEDLKEDMDNDIKRIKDEYQKRIQERIESEINNYISDNNLDKKISAGVRTYYSNEPCNMKLFMYYTVLYDGKEIESKYYRWYENDIFKILSELNEEKEKMIKESI